MSMRLRPHCSQCIYWKPDEPATTGHCHRFPPSVYPNQSGSGAAQRYPAVDHHSWCGEWSDDDDMMRELARRSMERSASAASRKA